MSKQIQILGAKNLDPIMQRPLKSKLSYNSLTNSSNQEKQVFVVFQKKVQFPNPNGNDFPVTCEGDRGISIIPYHNYSEATHLDQKTTRSGHDPEYPHSNLHQESRKNEEDKLCEEIRKRKGDGGDGDDDDDTYVRFVVESR